MSAAGGAGTGGRQRPQDGGGRGAPRGALRGQPPARRQGRLLRRCQVRWGAACGAGGLSPQGGHGCRLSRRRFLLCTAGDFVKVYSAATEELVRLLRGHGGLVTGVGLNPHNRLQVGRGPGQGWGALGTGAELRRALVGGWRCGCACGAAPGKPRCPQRWAAPGWWLLEKSPRSVFQL